VNLVLYGPPASGKTSVGRALARRLDREFVDTDEMLVAQVGMTIPEIFSSLGEPAFRAWESGICRILSARDDLVIACGGGALLNADNRKMLEASGVIVCLECAPNELLRRMNGGGARPLLSSVDPAAQLTRLLEARRSMYESFRLRVDTTRRTVDEVADAVLALTSDARRHIVFRVEAAPAYEVHVGRNILGSLSEVCRAQGLRPPSVVVSDTNVAPLHGGRVAASAGARLVTIPAGETHKTLDTVRALYEAFLDAGVERGGTIAALGGGVVGDIAGFAAASYLRGVSWINLPTSLLAMVDASIGGKVGVDLPQGKNLIGAFHMPALVAADLDTLDTLPQAEFRAGMAEVVKAGIIGDAHLIEQLEQAGFWERPDSREDIIGRAIAVKVNIVQIDPYERSGERAKLNLGHTIGHGIEAASGFAFRHGEAVAIGMVAEGQVAERIGLAESGLSNRIEQLLRCIGLPVRASGMSPAAIRAAMSTDKKKQDRRLKFALPKCIGEVVSGISVDDALISEVLREITHDG